MATGRAIAAWLALRELVTGPRALHAVLLALLLARVAGDVAGLLEGRAQLRVDLHERARDPVANRARLGVAAAALDGGEDVPLVLVAGGLERLPDDHPRGRAREVALVVPLVDGESAAARHQPDASHRGLAAAGCVGPLHARPSSIRDYRGRGCGCWAACL